MAARQGEGALRAGGPFANRHPAPIGVAACGLLIEVAEDGIHIHNRDGYHISDDPFGLFTKLDMREDVGRAFYLGVETARAEIAFRFGKRYVQDEPLSFGVVATIKGAAEDAHKQSFHESGPTRRQDSDPLN